MRTTETKSAFNTWQDGCLVQMSPFYTGKDALECEQRQSDKGNIATLHAFDSVEEGGAEYDRLCKEREAEESAWLPY